MEIIDGKAVYASEEEEAAFKTLLSGEVAGLKGKNAELLGKLKGLDAYKDIDPDEYRTLKGQAAKIEEERALKAGEFDNLKKQLLAAHDKEKETWAKERLTWQDEKTKLNKSLEDNVLIATATTAITAEKGAAFLLMPHVRKMTRLDEDGHPVVLDESGSVRLSADGKPVTIAQLITEMKTDVNTFGRAFESTVAAGSGAQQSNGSGSGKADANLSSVDKIKAGLLALNG